MIPNDELSADGCFHAFSEGINSINQLEFLIHPSEVKNATNFLDYNKPNPSFHSDLLASVAPRIIIELEECFEWVKASAAKDGARINFAVHDSGKWMAYVARQGERESDITIGLGCLPSLIGVANRLETALRFGPLSLLHDIRSGSRNTDGWNPLEDPMGILTYDHQGEPFRETTKIVTDAMMLILLHEASHACRGHMWIKKLDLKITDDELRRALESDADWGAGYLFVMREVGKFIPKKPNDKEQEAIVLRLTLASQCQYIAFQILAAHSSKKYHLPYTRMMDTMLGADAAWLHFFGQHNFTQLINNSYSKAGEVEFLMPEIFPDWIELNSAASIEDQKLRNRLSLSILRSSQIRNQILINGSGFLKRNRRKR